MSNPPDFLSYLHTQAYVRSELLAQTGMTKTRWRDRRRKLYALTVEEIERLAQFFDLTPEMLYRMVLHCYPRTDEGHYDFTLYTPTAQAALDRFRQGRSGRESN